MTVHDRRFGITGAAAIAALVGSSPLAAQAQPTGALAGMTAPKPDVEEVFTIMGEYVRIAYNNEGYAVVGYRMVQQEVGRPWALLSVGVTLRDGVKSYTMPRDAFSLKTPDGRTIPLPTPAEVMEADLRALNMRATQANDSIDYYPTGLNRPCSMQFFTRLSGGGVTRDSIELGNDRDCSGRLYFNVPGGIQVGQYFLNVRFARSMVQVPFRVFTAEEAKAFRKQWQDLKKAHDASYK